MIFWKRNITTAPAAEPLSSSETKNWLNVSTSDDDSLISMLIKMAREKVERDHDTAIITQTIDFISDKFSGSENDDGCVELAISPVQSITSVKYYDADNVEQTLAAENYHLDKYGFGRAKIVKAAGVSWPATYNRPDAVTVRAVCGFGDAAANVPEPLRVAMLLMVKYNYDNREDMPFKLVGRSAQWTLNNFFAWR